MSDPDEEFNVADRPLAKRKLKQFQAAEAAERKRDAPAPAPRAAPPAPVARPPPQAAPLADAERERAHMVDVGAKPVVRREATAEGFLRLRPDTVATVRAKRVKKGDPLAVAEVAAIQAVKATPTILPLCHPIPVTGIVVDLTVEDSGVRCRVRVNADYKTGVEMEALTGVSAALLTVWDMTKYLEKDDDGQYPDTSIADVRVVGKRKGDNA